MVIADDGDDALFGGPSDTDSPTTLTQPGTTAQQQQHHHQQQHQVDAAEQTSYTMLPKLSCIFRGTLIHSRGLRQLEVLPSHAVGVNQHDGTIAFVKRMAELSDSDYRRAATIRDVAHPQFIIPGFVDTHTHAPQYVNAGRGLGIPLLDWLNKYTFPAEAKFADCEHARRLYELVVKRTLMNGTTSCCYFATIHLEGTMELVKAVQDIGQRAFIGKVNMDRNSPDFYVETTEDSIQDTQKFLDAVISLNDPLVQPIITPRFVPSCSEKLLSGLSEITRQHNNIPIQSHVSENIGEVHWISELHPELPSYSTVYDAFGLLTPRTVLAHGIYLTDEELKLLSKRGCSISHCPTSNFSLTSGTLDIRRPLRHGIKVGLGTDISGGYSPSMLSAIRNAVVASSVMHVSKSNSDLQSDLSNLLTFEQSKRPEDDDALSFGEAFYLATLGGAECLGLKERVGNFEVGKEFDALIVDPCAPGSPFDVIPSEDTILDTFQKFLFLGDDRNLSDIFVRGKKVLSGTQC